MNCSPPSVRCAAQARRRRDALGHLPRPETTKAGSYVLGRRYGAFPPVVLHAHVLSQKPCSVRGLAHHYIAVSDYVANGLVDMGYPAERITTIRNGVDTNLFIAPQPAQAAAAKERLGVSRDTPVLAFVGRKHDVKGYPVFLQVAQRLLLEDRRILVLAIGADPERPSGEPQYATARARERALAVDPRFRSIPALPHSDLAALYHAIDVTLMPSLASSCPSRSNVFPTQGPVIPGVFWDFGGFSGVEV